MDWHSIEPHWLWLTAGVVLIAAEIIAPGFSLMWLGGAAIITGVLAYALPIAILLQFGIFAVLAITAVYAARQWLIQNPITSDDPLLNNRGTRMIGDEVPVVDAITNGAGRVQIGDAQWIAHGPDTPVGGRVRITGMQGSSVVVEAAG
jgi:membrane protein implicated in regulation of membrane protease activity